MPDSRSLPRGTDWHKAADYWRGRTGMWLTRADALEAALRTLLADGSVVAAATPEALGKAHKALSSPLEGDPTP